MTPLPRPVAEELGGKRRGLGQASGHAAPLPRPHPALRSLGAPPAPGTAACPRRPGQPTGSRVRRVSPQVFPPARPPARCGRESEDGKMATAPRSPSRPRYPPQARGEGLLPPPRERSGLSPPRPSTAAPGEQRARTRMEARAGAASAAGGKATRAPGIRCGGGCRGRSACPLAEPLD